MPLCKCYVVILHTISLCFVKFVCLPPSGERERERTSTSMSSILTHDLLHLTN